MKKPRIPIDDTEGNTEKPYEWSGHPKFFDGQLFPEEELLAMGEGDFDNRLDADYYTMKDEE